MSNSNGTTNHHKEVHWNEENLEKNESERCAMMKIDEPPTPFNFEYCQDDDEDPPADEAEGGDKPAQVGHQPVLSFADQWERAGLSEKLEKEKDTLIPTAEANQISEEEKEAARKKFDENRKKHYNMREAMALSAKYEDEDEDEDEKKKEEDVEVPHKRKADEAEVKP